MFRKTEIKKLHEKRERADPKWDECFLIEDEVKQFWWTVRKERGYLPSRDLAEAWVEARDLKLTYQQKELLTAITFWPRKRYGRVFNNLLKKGLLQKAVISYYRDKEKWVLTPRAKTMLEAIRVFRSI